MKRMLFREWFVVVCCLCFAGALFLMETFPQCYSLEPFKPIKRRNIEVLVEGAVERPGLYEVEAGASVKFVLEKAGLKATADLKALYLQKKLLNSCSLVVFEKKGKKERKKKRVSSSMTSLYMRDYSFGISLNV